MNLYVRRPKAGAGHICRSATVELIDADGQVVGYVQPTVADWLVRNGTAVDIT